jgi:CheY-like chemotaxis protein
MDMNLHRMDGIRATRSIKTEYPHVLVLGYSAKGIELAAYTVTKAMVESLEVIECAKAHKIRWPISRLSNTEPSFQGC